MSFEPILFCSVIHFPKQNVKANLHDPQTATQPQLHIVTVRQTAEVVFVSTLAFESHFRVLFEVLQFEGNSFGGVWGVLTEINFKTGAKARTG